MRGHRVGIVNPRTSFGSDVRELLEEQRLPTIELKLFETGGAQEAALTQFQDEVVVTQPLDEDLLPRLDALFISGDDADVLNRVAFTAAKQGVLTLVHGATGLDAPIISADSRAQLDRLDASARIAVIPRTCSYVLAELLGRVAEKLPMSDAVITVLLPARDLGDPGAEELHQQTVSLLNFKPIPTAVYGEQLAFNVQRGPGKLSGTIAFEVRGLVGPSTRVAVQCVRVPVFHGYASSIWVALEEDVDEKTLSSLRASLRSKPFQTPSGARALQPTPVGIESSSAIHVGSMQYSKGAGAGHREKGGEGTSSSPGLWLWVVADETAYEPAKAAIQIAKALL